ncbi:MAG TPA: hypothetical protein DCW94_06120 [Porticoccaceae bacterium]|nr:hypothetical protein [Porticoccaceae bacterium]
MIVEKNQATFNLRPSKTLLIAQVGLTLTVAIILFGLPIYWWGRLLAFVITTSTAVEWVRCWKAQGAEVLRCQDSERWSLDASGFTLSGLTLKTNQFVTRSLVILYFKTTAGKSLIRVLPADALPAGQHRLLRQLLIAR